MEPKKILLLTADPNLNQQVTDLLPREIQLKVASSFEDALRFFEQFPPDLFVLDYHLGEENGLEVFKKFKRMEPRLKSILIVLPGDINVAVAASRLGVLDVVRKPIEGNAFVNAIFEYLNQVPAKKEIAYSSIKNTEWLDGVGEIRKGFLEDLALVSGGGKDVVLIGGKGISSYGVAEVIHLNSLKQERKLVPLDLVSFQNESLESHFWVMIRELLLEQDEITEKKEELCGTLFLEAFDGIEPHFQISIFEFLREEKALKKRGKVDQGIKIILSIADRGALSAFPEQLLGNFTILKIPPLSLRREDLPVLMGNLVAKFNRKHGKGIQGVSLPVLDLLSYYPFPGNYAELENIIENAVLLSASAMIGPKELPLPIQAFLSAALASAEQKDVRTLEKVLNGFNKSLFSLLLAKTDGDETKVARILDLPVEGLTVKLKEVGLL